MTDELRDKLHKIDMLIRPHRFSPLPDEVKFEIYAIASSVPPLSSDRASESEIMEQARVAGGYASAKVSDEMTSERIQYGNGFVDGVAWSLPRTEGKGGEFPEAEFDKWFDDAEENWEPVGPTGEECARWAWSLAMEKKVGK